MKGLVLLLAFLFQYTIFCQNILSGYAESVPDQAPAYARLTFTLISNPAVYYSTFTNSQTGNYQINIPTGNYQMKVEVYNHFLFLDTLNISGSQQMDFQIIEDLGSTSTVHPNILNVMKTLTGTLDLFYPYTKFKRNNDYAVPIKFFANNDSIPPGVRQYLDSALDDIITKSNGEVQFEEVFTEPDTGIFIRYLTQLQMQEMCPGASGCILYDGWFPDGSPKHFTIIICNQLSPTAYDGVFRREFMRAMITYDYTTDPLFIMSIYAQTSVLHPDEGKTLQIMYTLKHNTDMLPHREIVVNELFTFQLTVPISNGWNMVSIPGLHPTDQNVNTWWQYRDQSANVFKYDGGYQTVTEANPGVGYWMKHSGAREYNTGEEWPTQGIFIVPHDSIPIHTGWNLISVYENPVAASLLTTLPPLLQVGPVYGYLGGYLIADNLYPGYGYWFKSSGDGWLIIP